MASDSDFPSDVDSYDRRHARREMNERKSDRFVNSPWFKILTLVLQAVLAVGVTVVGWTVGQVVDWVKVIDSKMNLMQVDKALNEKRFKDLEEWQKEALVRSRMTSERLIILEHEIKTMREQRQTNR